jgi:hypothetical protein
MLARYLKFMEFFICQCPSHACTGVCAMLLHSSITSIVCHGTCAVLVVLMMFMGHNGQFEIIYQCCLQNRSRDLSESHKQLAQLPLLDFSISNFSFFDTFDTKINWNIFPLSLALLLLLVWVELNACTCASQHDLWNNKWATSEYRKADLYYVTLLEWFASMVIDTGYQKTILLNF